ncbi:MAG: AarF/UbiB family protein [Verrucomicrobiota bacterium]|nr:AarF/UbiB family protein [Verrucomicrobiota bacterium]
MALSLRPKHLQRYKDIALLLAKYGRGDLFKGDEFADELGVAAGQTPKADDLASDLEKLGPTFVKLGQLLSTRADLLPKAYLDALSRLQDKVGPFPYEDVEAIIPVELGARISKAFSRFDAEPMAAASLGQVHSAALRDGRQVAVKVQRPGIRQGMVDDLEALEQVAAMLDKHTEFGGRYEFGKMLEQFRASLLRELDYKQEAANLKQMHDRLKSFERIVVPLPIDDYTTSRVLTMEYVRGQKITTLSPIVRLDIDGEGLAEELFKAYLQQILVEGFFHADPHPGNVFLTEDHRIALIDLGMVSRIGPRMQELLLQLLMAISEGRSDDAAQTSMKLGDPKEDFDELEFKRRIGDIVGRNQNVNIEQIQVGGLVLEVTKAAADSNMRVPPELTMLGKTLLNLDLVGRSLDEKFDPNASIRRNAGEILQHRLIKSISPGNLFNGLLEVKDLVERLPSRLNRILDAIASNNLRVKVDTIDEQVFMTGLQKIANRITLGLILAALIIGAAMLMRVETTFRIFGYPGFAIICFLLAAGGGAALAVQILAHDRNSDD